LIYHGEQRDKMRNVPAAMKEPYAMQRSDFLDPENWRGGPSYGLTMAWIPPDDARILRAMRALWESPCLHGPWSSPARFPGPVDMPSALDREVGESSYGLLRLAAGTEVGCRMIAILNEQGAGNGGRGTDWLEVVVMRGMQERSFSLVYFTDHFRRDNPWLNLLDAQFLVIAEAVYAVSPFAFATIDHEGVLPFADDLSRNFAAQLPHGGLLLPPPARVLLPDAEDWLVRDSGLYWLPSREA
jgi:hypothetical protein